MNKDFNRPTEQHVPQHPIDRLTEQARIRGDARMLPENSKPEHVTPAVAAEIIRNVENYKREKKLTLRQIAKGIGVAESTISQILSGKYQGDGREHLLDLDRWLDDQSKIDLAPKPAQFVWTRVARQIETIGNAAVKLQGIGLLYGPETSGLGKTTALQAIASERPGCIFVTVEKVSATTGALLAQICKKLRIADAYHDRHAYERICDALAGTSRLLIVDQIHNFCGARGDKPLYVLAEMQERTKAPQLWAGTSDIVSYLERGQAKGQEPLCQIRSRICIQCNLADVARSGGGGDGGADGQLYTIDEIRAIFGKNKMRLAPDAAKYLLRLANLPDSGALRSCKNLVIMATTLYQDKHEVLTHELLRAAHRMLITDVTFNVMQARIEDGQGTLKLKVG
jgi:predicted XRE-type DNA-binding protein